MASKVPPGQASNLRMNRTIAFAASVGVLLGCSCACAPVGLRAPAVRTSAVLLRSVPVSTKKATPPPLSAAPQDLCAGVARPEAVAVSDRVTLADFWSALSEQVAHLDTTSL